MVNSPEEPGNSEPRDEGSPSGPDSSLGGTEGSTNDTERSNPPNAEDLEKSARPNYVDTFMPRTSSSRSGPASTSSQCRARTGQPEFLGSPSSPCSRNSRMTGACS